MSTRLRPTTGRGVLCQLSPDANPRDFWGKNISGSLGYIEKAPGRSIVRVASHPRGPPPPQGSAVGGQNISILNVSTYNSDNSSIHRTLRTSRYRASERARMAEGHMKLVGAVCGIATGRVRLLA